MYETQYGGASVEALANLVFVEALSAMGHACPELDLPWMLQAEVSQRP